MWVRASQFAMPSVASNTTYTIEDEGIDLRTLPVFDGDDLNLVNDILFGGSGLSVKVGDFTPSGSSQSITGVGFEPSCIILWGCMGGRGGNGPQAWSSSFGVATGSGSGDQWVLAGHRDYLQSLSNSRLKRGFWDGSVVWQIASTGGTYPVSALRGTLSSFDADGFTIAWTGSPSSGCRFGYLALYHATEGFKAGVETESTSNGVRSTTGVGFLPQAVLFASHGSTTTQAEVTHQMNMIGCATTGITDAQVVASTLLGMNDGTGAAYSYYGDDRALQLHEYDGSTPWVDKGYATCEMTSDGFDLDWSNTDGTARKFGYLAIEGGDSWGGQEADASLFHTVGYISPTTGLDGQDPQQCSVGFQSGTGTADAYLASYWQEDADGNGTTGAHTRTDSSAGYFGHAGSPTNYMWSTYVTATNPLPGGFVPQIYRRRL